MDISQSSGDADYEWVIALNRACLRLLGIWPEDNKTLRTRLMSNLRMIAILTVMIWSTAVPTVHSLIRIWGDVAPMIDNLQYSFPFFVSMMKCILIWRKREVLVPILKMVKEDWTKSKTERERAVMINRAHTARTIMILGYLVMLLSFILVVTLPSFGVSLRFFNDAADPARLMPLQSYYIYNISRSPIYEVTFVLQDFSLMASAAMYTGTDAFMGLLIFHVCGQLENLKARILRLDRYDGFEDDLFASVQDHIRLIRAIKAIDNTFNLMLLSLMIYFGIFFASYGFLIVTIMTENRSFSVAQLSFILTAFVNIFTHMCLYCALGEFLVIQCDGIYEAACQYKWYKLKPRQARNLLTIMMQANRPLYLTAGKMFPMTMATFCNVLKTSGGYISVLLAQRD